MIRTQTAPYRGGTVSGGRRLTVHGPEGPADSDIISVRLRELLFGRSTEKRLFHWRLGKVYNSKV